MSLRIDTSKTYPTRDFEKKEPKVKQSGFIRAVQDFCKDTTLHGFKYLTSKNYYDRVGWLVCCGASACCAGVLCSVLWARFLQVPALLTLQDLRSQLPAVRMPLVAVCPSAESAAYYFLNDLVGWLVCCGASACCAGVLCSVLWARFLQVPALLTLQDLRSQLPAVRMPLVAVCPSAESAAYYFLNDLSVPESITDRLPTILSHVLQRKKTSMEHLEILEDVLVKNNLTLPQALMTVTPPCSSMVLKCRWQLYMIPCKVLFRKELTDWGACCVARPYNLSLDEIIAARSEVTRRFSISVQCSDQSAYNGCEFFTKYDGEEWVQPMPLTPGYNYLAHITFTSFEDSDPEKITEGTCVSTPGYSRSRCLLECKERYCGCSEPLRNSSRRLTLPLPPCSITRLACLRATHSEKNASCNCVPACKKVFTYMALESSPMNAFQYANDEIYAGLNASISSVLRITVRMSESRLFVVNSTETWITLLSSLGGVFNMFLGVGLFSALELLFLVCVRLPIALRRHGDMVLEHT